MLRSTLFVLGLAACATAPPVTTAIAGADRHGQSCGLDSECPNGSCRSGTCSWAIAREEGDVCNVVEVKCFGGNGACKHSGVCALPVDRAFAGPAR